MATITVTTFWNMDSRKWTSDLLGTTEQDPLAGLVQGDIVKFAVRFVQGGAAVVLTAPVFTASGIKALNDFTGGYLIQLSAPVLSDTTLYTFTVSPLNSAQLNTFLQTYRNTWCALELYDSANGILTTPLELQITPGYSLSGTPTDNAPGTLVVAAGKTVTFPLTLTFPSAAGTNGQQLTLSNSTTGLLEWAASGISGLTVGTTTITSGTTTRVLYDNAGVVGEYAISGTGSVAMTGSPSFTGTLNAEAATFTGAVATTSNSGTIATNGATATIVTNGENADIYTSGNNADIYTSGTDAVIYTQGINAYILSSGTFKLKNVGNFTTTLSHAATADRAIAFPDAAGTVAVATASGAQTHALFATTTSGAPQYRAIAATDLPGTLSSGTAITNAALTTPSLGAATADSINGITITPGGSGALTMEGSINTSVNGGYINTGGNGIAFGGNIDTSSDIGNQDGGSINTSGGSSGAGGSINTSGGSGAGGSIDTSSGGGSINTTAGGSITTGAGNLTGPSESGTIALVTKKRTFITASDILLYNSGGFAAFSALGSTFQGAYMANAADTTFQILLDPAEWGGRAAMVTVVFVGNVSSTANVNFDVGLDWKTTAINGATNSMAGPGWGAGGGSPVQNLNQAGPATQPYPQQFTSQQWTITAGATFLSLWLKRYGTTDAYTGDISVLWISIDEP